MLIHGNVLFILADDICVPPYMNLLAGIEMTRIKNVLLGWQIWRKENPKPQVEMLISGIKGLGCFVGAHIATPNPADVESNEWLKTQKQRILDLGLTAHIYCDGNEPPWSGPNDDINRYVESCRKYVRIMKDMNPSLIESSAYREVFDIINGVGCVDQIPYMAKLGIVGPSYEANTRQFASKRTNEVKMAASGGFIPTWYRKNLGWIGEEIINASTPVTLFSKRTYGHIFRTAKNSNVSVTYRTTMERLERRDSTLTHIGTFQ